MAEPASSRRSMAVSPLWMQGMLLTFLIGFAILGYLALGVYEEHAPVPARIVDEAGREIISGEEIIRGQEAFLTYGLMQFGSVYGHGAFVHGRQCRGPEPGRPRSLGGTAGHGLAGAISDGRPGHCRAECPVCMECDFPAKG
jgi:hypothetical protein